MNTLRNIVLSLCIGSIVAIAVNLKLATDLKFNSTALALGFFVFSALFVIKPIKAKDNSNKLFDRAKHRSGTSVEATRN